MKQSKLTAVVCLLLVLAFISGCFPLEYTLWRPEEGIWYCDELQMQLSFEDGTGSYIVIDGQKVPGEWWNDKGSRYISLACMLKEFQDYQIGDTLFNGKYVDLNENQYTLKDTETGKVYVFTRID